MNLPTRPLAVLATATLGVIALAGCQSEPSTRGVAHDIVETMREIGVNGEKISAVDAECMIDTIDDEYTDEELEAIVNDNADLIYEDPQTGEQRPLETISSDASEGWNDFVDDLRGCLNNGRSNRTGGNTEAPTTTDA